MRAIFFFSLIVSVLFTSSLNGQDLVEKEKDLVVLLDKLRSANDDAEKGAANTKFKEKLEEVILLNGLPFLKFKISRFYKKP